MQPLSISNAQAIAFYLHYLASACVYTHYNTEIDRFLIGVTEVFALRKPWHSGDKVNCPAGARESGLGRSLARMLFKCPTDTKIGAFAPYKHFAKQNLGGGRIHFARAFQITLGSSCLRRTNQNTRQVARHKRFRYAKTLAFGQFTCPNAVKCPTDTKKKSTALQCSSFWWT